jgi:hypothetical protein
MVEKCGNGPRVHGPVDGPAREKAALGRPANGLSVRRSAKAPSGWSIHAVARSDTNRNVFPIIGVWTPVGFRHRKNL